MPFINLRRIKADKKKSRFRIRYCLHKRCHLNAFQSRLFRKFNFACKKILVFDSSFIRIVYNNLSFHKIKRVYSFGNNLAWIYLIVNLNALHFVAASRRFIRMVRLIFRQHQQNNILAKSKKLSNYLLLSI